MRLVPVVDDTEYYWSGGRRQKAEDTRARSREWQRAVAGRPRPPAGEPFSIPSHGISGYTNYRCRCSACRQAWAAYCKPRQAAWRERKRREAGVMIDAKPHRREETA